MTIKYNVVKCTEQKTHFAVEIRSTFLDWRLIKLSNLYWSLWLHNSEYLS